MNSTTLLAKRRDEGKTEVEAASPSATPGESASFGVRLAHELTRAPKRALVATRPRPNRAFAATSEQFPSAVQL